jgi:hypothetical protein
VPNLRALVRRSEIDAVALAQGGAISRPQAITAGMSPPQLTFCVNTGRWQRVHPGVFVVYSAR